MLKLNGRTILKIKESQTEHHLRYLNSAHHNEFKYMQIIIIWDIKYLLMDLLVGAFSFYKIIQPEHQTTYLNSPHHNEFKYV